MRILVALKRLRTAVTGRGELYPHEREVLRQISLALPPDAAALLQSQVRLIDYVQRLVRGREVNCYCHREAGAETLFAVRDRDVLLARVRLTLAGRRETLGIQVWVTGGRVFQLAYDRSPQDYFEGHIPEEPMDVAIGIDQIGNPQEVVSKNPRSELPASAADRISQLVGGRSWTGYSAPYDEATVRKELAKLDTAFPADFMSLLALSDGLTLRGWSIAGLFEVRTVPDGDKTYVIIAERDGLEAIAVEQRGDVPLLSHINYESGSVRALTASGLVAAILQSREQTSRRQ